MADNVDLSDQYLVEQFVAGDSSGLENLINRYKSRLYSYILYTIGNRSLADDMFQETCLKAIRSILNGKYQDQGKMLSWFLRIAHNLIMDHYRREQQYPIQRVDFQDYAMQQHPQYQEASIEDVLVHGQVMDDLRALLSRLPQEQKDIVLLRFYGEMSFKEIAELTGVSINTALGRMRYALINLRKMMNQHQVSLT